MASGFALRLGLVMLGGLVLRLAYVFAVRHDIVGGDGWSYHFGAIFLAEGRGFVDAPPFGDGTRPSALHPPLWTILLAVPSLLGFRSWLEHQVFACLLGTATVAMVGIAGRRIAGARAGLFAASIAALYPGLWVYERQLLSEVLAQLLAAASLYLAHRFGDRPSAAGAVGLGGACGLLTLTRSEQILLAVALVAPVVLLAKVDWRRRVTWLACAGATTFAVILPWTLHNLPRFERPVLLSANVGGAMKLAACDRTFYGPLLGYYDRACTIGDPVLRASPPADASVYDARFASAALDYVGEHLDRLPIVVLARQGRAWSFFRPFQQARLESDWKRSRLWVDGVGLLAYWMLLPAAWVGAVRIRRRGRPLYPLLAFVWTTAVAVAVTYGAVRLRACAEVPLVLLAGIGLAAGVRRPTSARADGAERPSEPSFG